MVISYFSYLWDIEGISAGSAIKAIEFIEAIRRKGHTVHLEWRTDQPDADVKISSKVRNGLKPFLHNALREPSRLASNFGNLVREYRILRAQEPDVFFPRLEYGNFSNLLLARWLDLPMVVEADCPPTHEWKSFFAQDAFRFGDLSVKLELATLNRADAVITQSHQLSDYYTSMGVAAKKIHMIPNAADVNKFQPFEKDQNLLAKHKLKDRIVVGWVGAGIAWTGIDVLRGMMHDLLREYPNVSLLMLGSRENMKFFQQEFQNNGYADRFILPGFVPHDQIPKYLSCMDIVLAPYPKMDFFYASSMKLFEYMAAGKAIVATRIGQVAEVIQEGENGFLFDPDNPRELFEKVSALVTSQELRNRVGAVARRHAEGKWNWDCVADRMLAVFDTVIENRKKRNAQTNQARRRTLP